jgi:hypothetical protein
MLNLISVSTSTLSNFLIFKHKQLAQPHPNSNTANSTPPTQPQSKMSSIQTDMILNTNPNCLRILSADTIKANGGYQWKQVYAGVVGDESKSMLSQKGNELYSLMKTKIQEGKYEWLFKTTLFRVEFCTYPFAKPFADSLACSKYDDFDHISKINVRYAGLTLSNDESLAYVAPSCVYWQTSYVIFETKEEDASKYGEDTIPDPICQYFLKNPISINVNLKTKWVMTETLKVYRLLYFFIRTDNYCKLRSNPIISSE